MKRGLSVWCILMVLAMMLALAPAAAAEGEIEFTESTYNAVAGFQFQVALKPPVGSDFPEDLEFRISNKKTSYAIVDPDTGIVTPRRQGRIYLYAVSATDMVILARCILDIKWNLAQWSVYKNTSEPAIITPKRIYRHNGKTIGEMWLYNKSFGAGIKRIFVTSGSIAPVLVDFTTNEEGDIAASANLGSQYKFPSKIYKGKAGVIKVEFKNASTTLDFTTGNYSPWIVQGFYLTNKGPVNRGIQFSAE